jgi:serine/threonine-protein kinase
MVGQILLGRYKVMRPLDEGGMSRIFVARQLDQAREVVVKILKPEFAVQAKAREHFRREIHILSRFQHPNTVTYYDADPHSETGPILVMEYLRGVDLGILLGRKGRFAPDRTGRILAQVCDVLQAAHDAGIVHRDLKPGNLFILHQGTPQETVKLMDFGLAKMSSLLYIAPEEVAVNEAPTAAGTPEYISPEQLRGTEVDGRSDLYSLGVILYEMLAGKRPFERPTVEELLVAHADEEPPTFADLGLRDFISPDIERVVRSCLAKHPEDRPRCAAALIYAYEKALGRRLTQGRSFPGTADSTGTTPVPVSDRVAAVLDKARTVLRRESAPETKAMPTVNATAALQPRQPHQTQPTNLNAHRPGESNKGVVRASDRSAIQHSIEARMPEAMVLVKLKGFIYDLGGEILESMPGMIRVSLGTVKQPKPDGLLAWLGGGTGSKPQPTFPPTVVELHMERRDPSQPSQLTITLVMRPAGGSLPTAEWRTACQRVTRELQAYLMGR